MRDLQKINIEEYIDYDYIHTVLDENKEKEIFCFGTGLIAEGLFSAPFYGCNIVGFLDNNDKLQGTSKHNIPIYNPDILVNKEREKVFVLITSMYHNEIGKQLEEYGLRRGKHYIEIHSSFVNYFRIKEFEKNTNNFLKHLNSIPEDTFKCVEKDENPIGVVCSVGFERIRPWFAIEECLILRYYGYDCVCIIDSLRGFDDEIHFNGITEVALFYIKKVIDRIKEICPDFRVLYINSECDKAEITDEEIEMCENYVYELNKWFESRKEFMSWRNKSDKDEISLKILKRNLPYIKQFFIDNKFSAVAVSTGAHKHRCLYKLITEELGLRLITYDGGAEDQNRFLFTTNGISSHHKDVSRLINEEWFNEDEQERLFSIAEKDFNKRINSTYKDDKFYFQLIEMKEVKNNYDIIMPLNISWDAAALFQNRLFKNDLEWICQTVEFIMNNIDSNIMIREHPCKVGLKQFDHPDLKDVLRELEKYGKRVRICFADEEINTYSYVKGCKIVLPYSSTVGLEATALGKKILVHTDCYYSDIGISENINSKQEYFNKIKYYLDYGYEIGEDQKRKSILALFYLKNDYLKTEFTEGIGKWLTYTWSDFISIKEIENVKNIIVNNTPALYYNLVELLKGGE